MIATQLNSAGGLSVSRLQRFELKVPYDVRFDFTGQQKAASGT